MSFDLINTLVMFQAYINHILHDLVNDFCIVYLDNILMFSKLKEKYLEYLKLIIKYLHHAKLYANLKKCEFFKSELKYLRFIINKNNICMNFKYVKTISE